MEGRAGICLHGGRATGNVRFQLSVPPRRSQDMNGTTSAGFTVWFTGMSGAGKSTLAAGLANRLRRLGKTVEVLDGGEAEQFLNVAHGQNEDARNLEARKLAWVCRLVTRGGGIVLQAAIESPYKETRDEARRQIGRFAEVFVECPIETLIQRDKTGRYKKALAGELKNLVGISEPYEPPQHPEVIVDTSKNTVDEAVEHILGQLVAQRLIDPTVAALKSRPKISARGKPRPTPAPAAPRKAPKPEKIRPVKLRKTVKLHKKAAPKHRAAAFTAVSPAVPPDELEAARALARDLRAEHVERSSAELDDPNYARNPIDRCYFCKTELYDLAREEAHARGLAAVVSGTNADELRDYRPGLRAADEHEVVQPLAEAGLTKAEIRALSRELGLPTWDKPQQPCLSSRIPYGTEVTRERLDQLARAEMALRALGLREFRVRWHGDVARIEVAEAELPHLLSVRAEASRALREAGFKFVSVDLEPFRSGRLNEAAGLVPLRPPLT